MFDGMQGIPADVCDGLGRKIGSVQEKSMGRNGDTFWTALSLDGCYLGLFRRRLDAEGAVFDDECDGRPRREDGRLWSALHDGTIGIEPSCLGRAC